ncbi:GTP-binding protein [Dokdonella koreensis]|uniref:GTPase n=1 Tax=Dokdonella koreensis DS-123 TaxID=1300342 RepID=A0A160DSC6_9GAMM|nr:ATP/GTP-binding protein [Dokdonella koreensis]ANB16780.1 Putative GTPase [Dokdonella koreensis DS-123]
MAREHVILFAGPMGAGKTTAIASVSEIPVVSTEAHNTDTARSAKATTTVALDYGEITLADGDKVRLYGLPGQERFDFMWRILEPRAIGMVLLVDNAGSDPLAELDRYLNAFSRFRDRAAVVVGVTRTDLARQPSIDTYYAHLRNRDLFLPVLAVDARNAGQIGVLLSSLIVSVEARSEEAVPETP